MILQRISPRTGMRIESVEAIPIALPFRERYRTASGELDVRSMAALRLRGADGTVAWGEAVPLSLRGGPSLERVTSELRGACAEVIEGAELGPFDGDRRGAVRREIEALLADCARRGAGAQARCAVDVALHDLAARTLGVPLWRLLGEGDAAPVRCNGSLDAADPGAAADRARELAARGFETFKVKVGAGADAERVAAVRAAVGPEARLRIDANGAWGAEEAIGRLRELGAHRLELAEQPCATLAELAEVRARGGVPVVADESVASTAEARAARDAAACDAVTVKLAKVGGVLEAIRIAEAIPSYLSSALDGPIGIAAAVHLAAVLPRTGFAAGRADGLATLEMFAHSYAAVEGLSGPLPVPPQGPGLGIEVEESRLQALRVR